MGENCGLNVSQNVRLLQVRVQLLILRGIRNSYDIVNVGQNLGLETDNYDVEERLNKHQAQLTTKELPI